MEEKNSVLITGATGLIGEILLEKFLDMQYQVIFTSRNKNKITALYEKYSLFRKKLFGCQVDLLEKNSMKTVEDFLADNDLKPRYLINNARSLEFLQADDFRKISRENWIGEYTLDVVIPYELTLLLSEMKKSCLESVVNVSSMYGILAYNDYLCNGSSAINIQYGTAKAALIQLTRELAVRLANKNIRVNCISYGGVEGRADDSFKERYAKICPSRKMLSKDEITGHVVYLCSESSRGMTGANIVVDGGFSLW